MTDAPHYNQMLKTIFSLVVMIASAAVLFFRFVGLPPDVEARPHVGIGEALAEQAAKTVSSGGKIILLAPDTSVFRYPGYEVQLKAFFAALRKAHLGVAATNLIKLDPLYLVRVPPGDFANVLRKQPESDVVVSLLGPPILTADQKAKLPAKRARVVALCSGDMPRHVNLKTLFDEDLLHVALVSRATPSMSLPQADNPRVWFDHFYQIVTPQNLADLATPTRLTP